jgi:hypothetical protein
MATAKKFSSFVRRMEGNARQQIKALQKGVEQGIIKIPIGPGPIGKLLKGVRKLRREVNGQLAKIERALLKAQADARKSQRGR